MSEKYKVGEKVIVVKPDDFFNKNDVGIVKGYMGCNLLELKVIEGKNVDCDLVIPASSVEKFLEPKFKVGDIVKLFPGLEKKDSGEIVKVALNKKRKTYYYMIFCTDDTGYAVIQEEGNIIPMKVACKVCCKCGK